MHLSQCGQINTAGQNLGPCNNIQQYIFFMIILNQFFKATGIIQGMGLASERKKFLCYGISSSKKSTELSMWPHVLIAIWCVSNTGCILVRRSLYHSTICCIECLLCGYASLIQTNWIMYTAAWLIPMWKNLQGGRSWIDISGVNWKHYPSFNQYRWG